MIMLWVPVAFAVGWFSPEIYLVVASIAAPIVRRCLARRRRSR